MANQAAIAAGAAFEGALATVQAASFGGDNHAFINGYPSSTLSIHRSVTCDECGQSPLRGTRFMSTRQPNYDVCAQCLHENHGGSTRHFTVLRHPRALVMMAREPESGARSVTVYSFYELIDVLEGNEVNDALTGEDTDVEQARPGTVADITMHVGTRTPHDVGVRARQALASHTGLKSVHLNVFGTDFATDIIQILCDGLSQNKSVATVAWAIPAELSPEAAQALQNLMLNNRETMRFLFVQQKAAYVGWQPHQDLPPPEFLEHELEARARARARIRAGARERRNGGSKQDKPKGLEDLLFDALVTTSTASGHEKLSNLHTFRFQGISPVSDRNKQKAWQAMQTNPNLRRIKASFEHDDYQLELLTLDKKHRWTERWVQKQNQCQPTRAPSYIPVDERWAVLEEALAATSENTLSSDASESSVEETDSNSKLNKVAVLYHFLRYQPAILMECASDGEAEATAKQTLKTSTHKKNHGSEELVTEIWV